MILITGATGHLGEETIKFLIDKNFDPNNIIGLVRDEQKAATLTSYGVQIRNGDYDDVISLEKAFQGIDKLLFISGSDILNRDKQHYNVVDAAVTAKVNHIYYTSASRRDDNKESGIFSVIKTHIDTENYIIESGLNYTFFRNALYAEGIPDFVGPQVLVNGIFLPAGNGKVPFATRSNMAEAIANVLLEEDHFNEALDLVNNENYSFSQIAEILTQITGKQVVYNNPSKQIFKETLQKAEIPIERIMGISAFMEGIKQGYFEKEHTDLERLLGRKPDDLLTVLKAIYTP
ncbi:MAG: SDR family oxidoreductase [Omnitrophica WOR_2 bacterium]